MANHEEHEEVYHQVPASRYFYISDKVGAVPKGFFKYWTTAVIALTAAATVIACETNWWQIFFTRLANLLFITYWYIGWPALLIGAVFMYVFVRGKNKQRRKK